MGTLDIILAGACSLFVLAAWHLWRFRAVPGVIPALLLVTAVGSYVLAVVHGDAPPWLLTAGYFGVSLTAPLLLTAALEYVDPPAPLVLRLRWLPVAVVAALASFGLAAPWISYLLVLATTATAIWKLTRSAQRREMLALATLPVLVMLVDIAHAVAGVTLLGDDPTPLAMVVALLTGIGVLHSADTFDLRPAARAELVDSVMDGMLVIDAQRRVVDCNRAAERLLGRDRRSLLGKPARAVLPREFLAMLQSPVHLRSEIAVRETPSAAWFEVDVTPLDLRGRPAGHLLVARSIAERRRVHEDLERSRNDLLSANARLAEQSITDPLTNLKNRRFLFQRLNEELNRHHRTGEVLGLLIVDIDHFKVVNDTHGHPVGDEALVLVANALVALVRDCDVVARIGGEEFAVLAVNSDADGLVSLAERIRQAVVRIPVARNTHRPMVLTVSIGVAFADPDSRSVEGLFAEADRHLYAAKHQGRNRVVAAHLPTRTSSAG